MKPRCHILYAALALICMSSTVFAQTARLYDSGSGLPSTQINDLFQDSGGLLWVATSNGLYGYDGMNFMGFHHEESKENTLGSELVAKVFEDSKGVLWVGTSTGLQIYNAEYNTFTDFPLSDNEVDRYIYGLEEVPLENGKSGILVSASQFGLCFIDSETHELDPERRERFRKPEHSGNINVLFIDSKSRIWAGSELGGMFVFNTLGESILEGMWDGTEPGLSKRIIATSFTEDSTSGDIIIATSNHGILVYDDDTGRVTESTDREARNCKAMSLLSTERFHIADRESILVGTENEGFKLYSHEDGTLRTFSFPNVPYKTGGWKVHKMLEDSQGNIWIAAFQTGLMIVPQSMFGFQYYSFRGGDQPGVETNCLTSACRDEEGGRTWLGSDGNGLYLLNSDGSSVNFTSSNSGLPDDSVTGVALDRHGTLWVGTYLDGLVTYTPSGGFRSFTDNINLGSEKIFCLIYDADDDLLYAGTHGNGVAIISPSTGKVVRTLSRGINRWVNCLTFDKSGTLWIGTYNGHWCYSPDTGQMFRADIDQELIRRRVYSIQEGKDDVIWLGTGDGLIRFDQTKGETRLITESDGLSSNLISGILEGDDGSL